MSLGSKGMPLMYRGLSEFLIVVDLTIEYRLSIVQTDSSSLASG